MTSLAYVLGINFYPFGNLEQKQKEKYKLNTSIVIKQHKLQNNKNQIKATLRKEEIKARK